ncbi:MAG: DUF167 domain-containing protein [Nanoarchaeota archaeon]
MPPEAPTLPEHGSFMVILKPNASKDEVLSYDMSHKAFRIAVAAPPVQGKANARLLRFIQKQTGKKASLRSGQTSKKKLIRLS